MKIICIGRNYEDHVSELQNERPDSPVIFIKPDSSIILKNQPFFIPDYSNEINYEIEVILKICKLGKSIEKKFAKKYYDQVGLGIDFTARDLQFELKSKGLPWEKAKAFDGSALVGEWFSKEDFHDIDSVSFRLDKNGQTVQSGNSSQMLWKINELIPYCSQFFTLKIGDIIFTGTPAGVGSVAEGDLLEGYLESREAFTVKIK